ncbi:hypothetical protein HYS28_03880, partial [Candidatus Uhrbacteria bacterium]|nr:hypothetical protein [Candidatus Uhrbacteria bacterium]
MPGLFDDLRKLPAVVREHLYSEELERWYADAHDRWGLPDDQRPEVEGAALDVYLRKRTLDQFVERLRELVGDEAKSKAIAIEILGNDFLKIEDYLGVNIPAYIKALGGDPSKFVKEIPVADVVAGVMKGIGVAPSDPVIVKRMEHAVTVFLTGVRDALETKDVLTRATKVGGVGLDAATADRIVQALTAQLKELRDAGVIVRTETVKPPETSTFHLVKPGKSSVMQPEDEAEIEQIRRKVAPGDVDGEKIRAAVDRVIQKTGAKFKNEDVTRRFRTAVESRIRDIRDHQETLDLFTRPSAAGGFGIPKEQAEKVLRVIEEEVRVVHGTARRMATDRYGSPRITDVRGESTTAAPPSPQAASLSPAPTTPVLPSPPPVATLVHPVPPTPQVASRQAGGQA